MDVRLTDIASLFREYMYLERSRRGEEGLALVEFERWSELKAHLNHHFQPGISKEIAGQRESVRVPTGLRVNFDSFGEICESLMTNMSRGGLFLATTTPLPIGSELKLRIRVEDPGTMIEVCGEVVSHNMGANLDSEEPGMGVRFTTLGEDQQKAVEDLYEFAAKRAIRSGGSEGEAAEGEPVEGEST